jgi:thymidylate synthase ThyX
MYASEFFTEEEKSKLRPYFTNLEGPVFALVNLPEVVKGALFARYSRSGKSLRRLFLDEFADNLAIDESEISAVKIGVERAEKLYETVFFEYGDDSVAQLGGVHLACEQVSNFLTKILERGRLMSYLEQSTRYIRYDMPLSSGEYRYYKDPDIMNSTLADRYVQDMNRVFEIYGELYKKAEEYLLSTYFPEGESTVTKPELRAIRALALDLLRGILPIGTVSNMGIYASGQAFEQLLLRMLSSDLPEARSYGEMVKTELMKVIPDFLSRVDRADRGGVWMTYIADCRGATKNAVGKVVGSDRPSESYSDDVIMTSRPSVDLVSYDPDGQDRVVEAILFSTTDLSSDEIRAILPLDQEEMRQIFKSYVGDRSNRRHKPGRAFESTAYNFEVISDYGAFRDLQRHRMLTIEWQDPNPQLGFHIPPEIIQAGLNDLYLESIQILADLHVALRDFFPVQAIYALPMATNIRYRLELNAREAMHLIELRSSPQGHPNYRYVAQEMHRLIQDEAGHDLIASAIEYVDFSEVKIGRLEAEKRSESQIDNTPNT